MNRVSVWYGGLSLKLKIMAVVLSVCAAALLWALAAFIALDVVYVRRSISHEITAQAEIVAGQTEAALVFGDRNAAGETLSALGRHTHVRRILLYAADGSLFASYDAHASGGAAGSKSPDTLETLKFYGENLKTVKHINKRGESLGWVYIESDMREMNERLTWLASVALLILGIAIPVVFLVARFLQATVADPLVSLVDATRSVARSEDYSVRAAGGGSDEIGELIKAFNKMLEQIQIRDEKLKRHTEELEHTVASRTSELAHANSQLRVELEERRVIAEGLRQSRIQLEEAKEKAEKATQLKNKFLSLVSHDLRSPLSSIIWAAEMLLSKGDGALSDEKKNWMLANVHSTSLGLITLINKLLDISRLQTGQIVPIRSVVRTRALVDECVDALVNMAERKRITIANEVKSSMIVYADHALFREVLNNLLTNAIKFTPVGGKVTVWAPDGERGLISVTDTGAGVPEAIIGDLFRHEVKTTTFGTAGEKGTGLGLPYCHDIMKAHNGDILVESPGGCGATFTISLPAVRTVVLVVDDQEAQRGVIRDILQEVEGVAVTEAMNGHNALKAIDDAPPNLVITDLDMPDMDGFTLIERIRGDGRIAAIPVIIVSASVQLGQASRDEVIRRAAELGAAQVLAKPVAKEGLLAAVREFVKG